MSNEWNYFKIEDSYNFPSDLSPDKYEVEFFDRYYTLNWVESCYFPALPLMEFIKRMLSPDSPLIYRYRKIITPPSFEEKMTLWWLTDETEEHYPTWVRVTGYCTLDGDDKYCIDSCDNDWVDDDWFIGRKCAVIPPKEE